MGDYGTRDMVTGVCMETGQKQGKGTKRMVTKTGRGWEGNRRKKRIKESREDGGKSKLKSEFKTGAAIYCNFDNHYSFNTQRKLFSTFTS